MTKRLLQLIDYLNISVREFERKIGVTEGVISKSLARKTGLKAETLQKIAEIYPQISLEWFLLGKGEMLRSESDDEPEEGFAGGGQQKNQGNDATLKSADVEMQSELSKMIDLLASKELSLQKTQEHIDKLLEIISNLTKGEKND